MNFTSSPFERMMKEVPHPGWDNDDPCICCVYGNSSIQYGRNGFSDGTGPIGW